MSIIDTILSDLLGHNSKSNNTKINKYNKYNKIKLFLIIFSSSCKHDGHCMIVGGFFSIEWTTHCRCCFNKEIDEAQFIEVDFSEGKRFTLKIVSH